MSRGLKRPRRLGRKLVLGTVLALVASVFYAPSALAQTTCDRVDADGFTTLTVNTDADQAVAIRFFGDTVDASDDVNAGATDFVPQQVGLDADCIAEASVELLVVNGTDAGVETLKLINAGTSAETHSGDVHKVIDLGAGNDTLEIMSADTNNNAAVDPTPEINIALGTSGGATAQTVGDLGVTTAGNALTDCVDSFNGLIDNFNGGAFDCSDLGLVDANQLRVTGGTDTGQADTIDAQGDFDDGFVDSTTAGVAEADDPQIPGTAGHEGLDQDGSGDNDDNEPNGGNLDQPLTADLNGGDDEVASGDGNDTLNGAGGFDFVEYNEAEAAVDVDLAAGTATGGSGTDSLANFQDVTGSVFDDNLLGNELANAIFANCGNDFIEGRTEDDNEQGDGGPVIGDFLCDDPGLDGLPEFFSGDDTFYQEAAAEGADNIDGNADSGTVAGAPDFLDTVDYGDRTTDLYLDANGAPSGEGGCPLGAGCEGDTLSALEFFIAGTANDTFVGSGADETFQGGAGNDNMSGGGGEDWFDFSDSAAGITVDVPAGTATGNGDDTFDGTVEGFNGSELTDTFNDDTSTNNLYWGNGGDDLFSQGESPSADADAFNGGDGVDTLDYGARTNDLFICLNGENPIILTCDNTNNGEDGETDTVQDDIENGTAGSGDDVLFGNERNNVLTDGDGNDFSFGDQGNDTFFQGAAPNGADDMTGGGGADFVDYSQRTGNVRASLGTGAGNNGEGCVPGSGTTECEGDTVDGVENASTGAGNDLLIGSGEDNILNAGAGNDLVNPAGGADVLDGGDGTDRVTYATGVGVKVNLGNGTAQEIGAGSAGGVDTLGNFENATGSQKADIIAGDANNNKLAGLAGKDIVKGKGGDDKLKGNQGRDNLNGGKGTDSGNGGPGRDRCRKVENQTSC